MDTRLDAFLTAIIAGALMAIAVNTSRSCGSSSPHTNVDPSLTIPTFSPAIASRHAPTPSVWSRPTFVNTATEASATLVAS